MCVHPPPPDFNVDVVGPGSLHLGNPFWRMSTCKILSWKASSGGKAKPLRRGGIVYAALAIFSRRNWQKPATIRSTTAGPGIMSNLGRNIRKRLRLSTFIYIFLNRFNRARCTLILLNLLL